MGVHFRGRLTCEPFTSGDFMSRWIIAITLTVGGMLIAFAGLAWGVINVGVPYSDPTPAQAAAERFHLSVCGWGIGIGFAIFVLGVLLLVALAAVSHLRRSP